MSTRPPESPNQIVFRDEAATIGFAQSLSGRLIPGDTILLAGQIGAGKSVLARAIIKARMARAGVDEDVPSPTFTLIQTYTPGGTEIWHADLYRLGDLSEVDELGLADAFDAAICLIEWPDRLGPYTPPDALTLELAAPQGQGDNPDQRDARLIWTNPKWGARLIGVLPDDG